MALNFFLTATVCLTALSVSGFAHPQQFFQDTQLQREPVTEVCLGCLCESISSCNRSLTCEGDVCGMFRITWAYWADSGKPVLLGDNPNDGLAYSRCANDPACARQSVVNYMARFAQDCDRNGVIDCLDYASIHMLGGYGCNGQLKEEFKTRYNNCQRSVNDLSGSENSNPNFQETDYYTLPPDSPK